MASERSVRLISRAHGIDFFLSIAVGTRAQFITGDVPSAFRIHTTLFLRVSLRLFVSLYVLSCPPSIVQLPMHLEGLKASCRDSRGDI